MTLSLDPCVHGNFLECAQCEIALGRAVCETILPQPSPAPEQEAEPKVDAFNEAAFQKEAEELYTWRTRECHAIRVAYVRGAKSGFRKGEERERARVKPLLVPLENAYLNEDHYKARIRELEEDRKAWKETAFREEEKVRRLSDANDRMQETITRLCSELKEAREELDALANSARNLVKVAEENEPEFQAHVRYTYADCQKIFKPVAEAIELLDIAVEALAPPAGEGKADGR